MGKRYSGSAHWRDTGRVTRFFMIDYRAAFPLFFFLLHIRWWTFWVAVGAVTFFTLIERYGFTVTIFFRWLRSALAGKKKLSRPWWKA